METIEAYITRLRDILNDSAPAMESSAYLDLATCEAAISPGKLASVETPPDILVSFQEAVMTEIAGANSDKIKMGINELLKHLLTNINTGAEHFLAERYLYRVRMIFKRCLMPDFPFPEEIWNYICDCLRSTGAYLVNNGFYTAAREIIDSLAGMGRIAALKGLPTANTQSSLRILENKALEKNQKTLASTAKNARFNLET